MEAFHGMFVGNDCKKGDIHVTVDQLKVMIMATKPLRSSLTTCGAGAKPFILKDRFFFPLCISDFFKAFSLNSRT